jgi:hypothetical protein
MRTVARGVRASTAPRWGSGRPGSVTSVGFGTCAVATVADSAPGMDEDRLKAPVGSRTARVSVRPFPDVDRFGEAGWVEFVLAFGALNGLLEELVRLAGWRTATAVTDPGGEVLLRTRVRGEAATIRAVESGIRQLSPTTSGDAPC